MAKQQQGRVGKGEKLDRRLGKYVDLLTDFGMKLYFSEKNKPLLISFLNSLFWGKKVIVDLQYRSVEVDGDTPEQRRVVFDLYCIGDDGSHFLIEMQRLFQYFYKDRTVYYTSRTISQALAKGYRGNDYELPEVYSISILEFSLGEPTSDKYFYDVALCDTETHEVFYHKLGYKFISLPHFKKDPADLKTDMDQWIYLMKHLSTMEKLPHFLDKRIFKLIFEIGEVAKLKPEDKMSYEASLKAKRDYESVLITARRQGEQVGIEKGLEKGLEKGRAEGLEKGRAEERIRAEAEKLAERRAMALSFKRLGVAVESIASATGLSIQEIEGLE